MAKYTEYLRLVKPEGNEYYNVENFNHNAELIDKETEKLNNAVTEIKNGATREKAGIVQFGTEEGKALEGMMLARLAGCVGYGGDIQEPGVKDINYIYYDRNTRKMYKCLNQNSDVSANVANFIPLDNNSLLDRLENLIKVIEVDTSNFTIVINYLVDTNLIVSGYLLVKSNFRVKSGGFIHSLGNTLNLNGSFLTYTIGNDRGKYFYQPHKISVKNGNIVSNVADFNIFTTRVFYE
ncbi:ribose-phosphate pyrophosphokinase [Fusobacterium polymorphum]|uniref:ribose-phosphate pyrophosphokinase n=1 Tax=Fusobacterium nucleatum subsp. polymorphum TaxID=76857 RepID=UPI003008F84F